MRYKCKNILSKFDRILATDLPGEYPVASVTDCGVIIMHPDDMSYGVRPGGIENPGLAIVEDKPLKFGDRCLFWNTAEEAAMPGLFLEYTEDGKAKAMGKSVRKHCRNISRKELKEFLK